MENKKQTGTIKFFNEKKKFGFIELKTMHDTKDIFFHDSELHPDYNGVINAGDKVTFSIIKGKKGFEAQDISKCSCNPEEA